MENAQPISNIGKLREEKGLTQRQLSQEVGVTETTIANWEKGRSGLEWISRIKKLCDALGCKLEDLLIEPPGSSESNQETSSFEDLATLYNTGKLNKKEDSGNSERSTE